MSNIVTCIDGSDLANAVCDAGAWASRRTNSPLKLLHVLEKTEQSASSNLSGNMAPGGRKRLLNELVDAEEQHSKLALEHGKELLQAAKQQAIEKEALDVSVQQRHGNLAETLTALDEQTRILVIGRHGEAHEGQAMTIGSQLESVIRAVQKPILITTETFVEPTSFMIAFDGRAVTEKALDTLIASPLLKGLRCHLVSVKNSSADRTQALDAAAEKVMAAGFEVTAAVVEGEILPSLNKYQKEHNIGLMTMGAYGHSRIRQFFVGSNTTKMVSSTEIPLIIVK